MNNDKTTIELGLEFVEVAPLRAQISELATQSQQQAATLRAQNDELSRLYSEREGLLRRVNEAEEGRDSNKVALWNRHNDLAAMRRERDEACAKLKQLNDPTWRFHNEPLFYQTAKAFARDMRDDDLRRCTDKIAEQYKQIEGLSRLHSEAVAQRDANARTIVAQSQRIGALDAERNAANAIVEIKIDEASDEFGTVRNELSQTKVERDAWKKKANECAQVRRNLAARLREALASWCGAPGTRYDPNVSYDSGSGYGNCQTALAVSAKLDAA